MEINKLDKNEFIKLKDKLVLKMDDGWINRLNLERGRFYDPCHMCSTSEMRSPKIESDWFYYLSPIGWLRVNIVYIREGNPIELIYVQRLELQLWRCSSSRRWATA